MGGIQREMQRARAWRKIIGLENGGTGMVSPPLTLQARLPLQGHLYTNREGVLL